MAMTDDARLNELINAILDVILYVRPRPGFLTELGVTEYDQRLINQMISECHFEVQSFDEYRNKKLASGDLRSMESWVKEWEDGIRVAVENLQPRISNSD